MSGHCKHCGYDGCLCDDRPSCHRCNGFLEPDGTCANFYCPNFTFKTNMNEKTESDTPETDEHQEKEGMAFDYLWSSFAKKLERERDEARREADNWRDACFFESKRIAYTYSLAKLPWEK